MNMIMFRLIYSEQLTCNLMGTTIGSIRYQIDVNGYTYPG